MMNNKRVHVRPSSGAWVITRNGDEEPISVYDARDDAILMARVLARTSDETLVIHDDDDSVRISETYTKHPQGNRE